MQIKRLKATMFFLFKRILIEVSLYYIVNQLILTSYSLLKTVLQLLL